MNRKIVLAIGCFASALCWMSVSPAISQPDLRPLEPAQIAPAQKTADKNAGEWRALKVQFVRPSLLAWWIDPQNNPMPREIQASRESPYFAGGKTLPVKAEIQAPGVDGEKKISAVPTQQFDLFSVKSMGIDAVAAVDSRMELVVFGKPGAWSEFEKLVGFLDKPIRSVEIETQYIDIGHNDSRALQINSSQEKNPNMIIIGREDLPILQKRLQALASAGRTRVIDTRRVTTLNNISVHIKREASYPMNVSITYSPRETSESSFLRSDKPDYRSLLIERAPNEIEPSARPALELSDESYYIVTPTINNDNSITLFLRTGEVLLLKDDNQGQTVMSRRGGMTTATNIKSGDVLIVKEVMPVLPRLPGYEIPAGHERQRWTLVSVRILQDLNNAEPMPVKP